ncbi:MAG: chorismate-binding protein [Bacteroidota bacterium]|jgi:isochorismate synthase
MTPETSIRLRCKTALDKGWSLALCRLPGANAIVQFYSAAQPILSKLDAAKFADTQFAFAPYASGNLAYVLSPDITETDYLHSASAAEEKSTTELNWHCVPSTNKPSTYEQYLNYVNRAIQLIRKHELAKVVAARCQLVSTTTDMLNTFYRMCELNKQAYVYLFSSPVSGTWLGSTPELLLSCSEKTIRTVALAGTKQAADTTAWGKKEQDEHGFVEAFIDDAFEQLNIQALTLEDVHEIQAGNIKHLVSHFEWCASDDELRKKFHKLLALLNPTPAVCGLPPMEASVFIAQHEHMERKFYSGFNGIVSAHDTQLYVTLRCMEKQPEGIMLYAGAGITSDSVAEDEWEETERKMQSVYLPA